MRIFADQCVNTDIIEALRNLRLQVITASEAGLDRAGDAEIFAYCLKNSRILLTFDKDFGNIIRFNIRKSHGTVIVYIEGMSREEILHRTISFFQHTTANKLKSRLFIIEPEDIRIWPK